MKKIEDDLNQKLTETESNLEEKQKEVNEQKKDLKDKIEFYFLFFFFLLFKNWIKTNKKGKSKDSNWVRSSNIKFRKRKRRINRGKEKVKG